MNLPVQKWTSSGTAHAKRVEYTYEREPEKKLTYRFTEEKEHKTCTIEDDQIVVVFPALRNLPDLSSLLYIEVSTDPDEHTRLKSLVLTSPSAQFMQDFSPASHSWWQPQIGAGNTYQGPSLSVVLSTKSGNGQAESIYNNILRPFLTHVSLNEGSDYTLLRTQSSDSITELTLSTFLPRATLGIPQTIVLLSGDGGIVDIVNGLLSSGPLSPKYAKPSIALLPLGTGNALAYSTGIAADQTFGLAAFARGSPRPLPLFKATFHHPDPTNGKAREQTIYGAVVFSWGLHASLVADSDTPEYRKHGAARFQMAAKENLFPSNGTQPHAYRGTVSVLRKHAVAATPPSDHLGNLILQPSSKTNTTSATSTNSATTEHWEPIPRQEHAYVLATLVSNLEATFRISPSSKPLDGQLRLIHFGPLLGGGDAIMRIMGLAYAEGGHIGEAGVGYEAIEGLRIDFGDGPGEEEERWRRVCVDGRIVVVPKGGWVEVRMEERGVCDLVWLPRRGAMLV